MTGLATGVGNVSAERCAQQMALAVENFIDASENPEKWSSMEWDDALTYAHDCRRTHRCWSCWPIKLLRELREFPIESLLPTSVSSYFCNRFQLYMYHIS